MPQLPETGIGGSDQIGAGIGKGTVQIKDNISHHTPNVTVIGKVSQVLKRSESFVDKLLLPARRFPR